MYSIAMMELMDPSAASFLNRIYTGTLFLATVIYISASAEKASWPLFALEIYIDVNLSSHMKNEFYGLRIELSTYVYI